MDNTSQLSYLCFHLKSKSLSSSCRRRLEQLGVDCLEEGGEYTAYGIAPVSLLAQRELAAVEELRNVDIEAPPCSK